LTETVCEAILIPKLICHAGMMMYELHLPLLMLANRELQKGPPSATGANSDEIKTQLKVRKMKPKV
jgi:hypothetical protein